MGARSLKPGQTRFFVGYKKHTLRLWISGFESFVLLVPLVTWAAPAGVPETYLLRPSVEYCVRRLEFRPEIVLGDRGYINHEAKRHLRVELGVAVLTRLKANMKKWCDYSEDHPLCCDQGQELLWLGYDDQDHHHWFGAPAQAHLCSWCWEKRTCPRQFAIEADRHETFFGMIPLNTALARRLTRSTRSWIEGAQSFEKNQLGLKTMFLNSLSLCWTVSLLADAAVLLRASALLQSPSATHLLEPLLPTQRVLALE